MLIVIDYNVSKTSKLQSALNDLDIEFKVSDNEYEICKADKLILPGDGIASEGIRKIHLLNLFTILRVIKNPLLGIGLGMEILSEYSPEGNVSCLGILSGKVQQFKNENSELPFKGMCPVEQKKESSLFKGINDGEKFYFDNSYYLPVEDYTTAESKNNSTIFSAAVEKNNFYGVQFHPETSGESGLKLLNNFINL
jgi:imidazole glycerol-phosphate synthase subunit HisH